MNIKQEPVYHGPSYVLYMTIKPGTSLSSSIIVYHISDEDESDGPLNCNFTDATLCDYVTASTSTFYYWTYIAAQFFDEAVLNPLPRQGKCWDLSGFFWLPLYYINC